MGVFSNLVAFCIYNEEKIMRVAIIMGSTSDLPKMEAAVEILKSYGVAVDVRCLSAIVHMQVFLRLLKKLIKTAQKYLLQQQVWQQPFRVLWHPRQ